MRRVPILLLFACAGAQALEIDETRFVEKELVFTLHADGTMETRTGEPLGALHPDGSFSDPSGKVVARVDADGAIVLRGKKTEARIDADGVAHGEDGRTFALAEDGAVLMDGRPMKMRALVAKPGGRRAAVLAVVLMLAVRAR